MVDDDVESGARRAADVARGIAQALTGERIEHVSYEVAFHEVGAEHDEWRVRRFNLVEGLSYCYEATIDLLHPDASVNGDDLLGEGMTVQIVRGSAIARLVHGIVHRVDYIGMSADNLLIRVYVVPAFSLLRHRIDSRIFQDVSVAEILRDVVETGLDAFEREVEWRCGIADDQHADKYKKRDYCVQYGESDHAFACRLMEEEGIFYFFEHDPEDGDGTKEKLVVTDQLGDQPNAGCPSVPIIDPDGAGEISIIPDRPDTADAQSIQSFDWRQSKQIPKVHARGFNFKAPDPSSPPEAEEAAEDSDGGGDGWEPELYLFGQRRKVVDKENDDGYDGTDVEEWAKSAVVWRDLFTSQTRRGNGVSNVIGFSAGYCFNLASHGHDAVNQAREFLLTRVLHSGDCPDVERLDTDAGQTMGLRYTNKFEAIPRDTPFRPPMVTPRPKIFGPQTATVTGLDGEEIHTDKHGRIKVCFHWDRISTLDDTSSCWVRVAQSWSGPGWGTLFIPRIGMEVVCEFLEGNPDRPLVTGCVYNGRNGTPYPLPDEKTKSTIKSNSSLGGDGFNEFRFEDAKGNEEVFLHAQKDYNEVVLNDHTTHVGHDQTHNVEGDRTRFVKGNENITIEGNQNITINGVPAHGDKGGEVKGKSVKIDGDYTLETTSTVYFKAPTNIKLEVPGSYILIEPGKISLHSGGSSDVVIDANVAATASGAGHMLLDGNALLKSAAGSKVVLDGNAFVVSSAGSGSLLLDGNALLKGGGAKVVLDGNALVKGGEVKLDGGGTVTANGGGVSLQGAAVSIKGDGSVSIKGGGATGDFAGGIVKLN
jgi:type VI secretion system secreted protein VgrG